MITGETLDLDVWPGLECAFAATLYYHVIKLLYRNFFSYSSENFPANLNKEVCPESKMTCRRLYLCQGADLQQSIFVSVGLFVELFNVTYRFLRRCSASLIIRNKVFLISIRNLFKPSKTVIDRNIQVVTHALKME